MPLLSSGGVGEGVSLSTALKEDPTVKQDTSFNGILGEHQRQDIKWEVFHANIQATSTNYEGAPETHFQRTAQSEHDASLGQSFNHGIHEWVVTSPNWSPNSFIGVAESSCDTRTYPAATNAWALQLHSGDLCSGVAAVNPMTLARAGRLVNPRRNKNAKGKRNDQWENLSVPPNTPVRVILDMDARALYFAVADEEPELAYTNLPASLHPYICSGDMGDRSVLIAGRSEY